MAGNDFKAITANFHKERQSDLISAIFECADDQGVSVSVFAQRALEDAVAKHRGIEHVVVETGFPWHRLFGLLERLVDVLDRRIGDVAAAIRERPPVVYASPGEVPANGNGHGSQEEDRERDDDPLVQAMLGMNFDF